MPTERKTPSFKKEVPERVLQICESAKGEKGILQCEEPVDVIEGTNFTAFVYEGTDDNLLFPIVVPNDGDKKRILDDTDLQELIDKMNENSEKH
jgi:hypothetical protein